MHVVANSHVILICISLNYKTMSRDQSGEFVCGYWGLKGQHYQHASLCTSVWEGGKCYIGYQHTH